MVLVVNTALFAQKMESIKGDKNLVTSTYAIQANFNEIEIDNGLEVSISQSNTNSYILTTDKNLQDVIQFTVENNVLKIHTTKKITSSKKIDINLKVKNLEGITLKENTKIEGKAQFTSETMSINAYKSSQFKLDLKADDITVTMQDNARGTLKAHTTNTTIVMTDKTDLDANIKAEQTTVTLTKSAEIKLEGDSDFVTFSLNDSAELNAKKMKISSASLHASKNVKVYITVKKSLELYALDNSNIYIYGDPKIDMKELSGKAKIIKK